ncbi:transcriptional regulator family: C2H2 zinc finger and Fungal Specific TF [Paecilomyces variotii]|nr:transcriptional regulator family: Fungal Specific TF and C2H2 zinc finger [Paecilomyces variotii]KAJ9364588.1 transcriptional regulator family: C2H2 zinc finger and Fungal Specific TF [Paecilomyces variotii]
MSTKPTENENIRRFTCQHPGCGATYRRKEHLARHAIRHSQRGIFSCNLCRASFDRSDTLQRHKKVHNKNDQPNPARVLKACNRCRIQKSRCDGQLPCSICQKRGVVCSFDRASPRSKRQHRQKVSASEAEIVSDSIIPQDPNRRLIDPPPPPPQQSYLVGRNDQELSPVASGVPNHRRKSESPPPSNSTISAKMQLVQHEEQLQREGLQLAPADSTVPWQTWPGNMFSSSYYSLDYPAGLDDDDYTTQPIDTAYYVRLYFLHFNPQWPFIHEASFRYQEEPTVLVLALVMIGLWITGEAKARRQAWKIHDRLHTLIKEQMTSWHTPQPEQQDISQWPMATYQSILLYIIFALIAGPPPREEDSTEALLDRVRSILTSLIETCLVQGLFFYPSMLARGCPDDPIVYAWARTEEAKRFSLTLFKVSNLFSGVTGDDARLSVSDLRFPLPDNGFLWGPRPSIHDWWRRRDLRLKNPAETEDRWISDIFEEARAQGEKAGERRAWLRMGCWLGFMAGVEP